MLMVICLIPISNSLWILRTAFTTLSKLARGSPSWVYKHVLLDSVGAHSRKPSCPCPAIQLKTGEALAGAVLLRSVPPANSGVFFLFVG